MGRKVILFGASTLGKIALEYLQKTDKGYKVIAFCDNDRRKWGMKFAGIPVISPEELKKENSQIIITSLYDTAIVKQLFGLGIFRFAVFSRRKGHDFFSEEDYQVREYDYRNVNLKRNDKRIALRSVTNSGSNTLALYKLAFPEILERYDVRLVEDQDRDADFYYNLLTSKTVVMTHDLAFDPTQINIQLWHGFPLKGLSYMSKYSKQDVEQNHLNWSKLDIITSYSQLYSTLMNACYGVSWKKYVVTGMPRNDFLFNSDGRKKLTSLCRQDFREKKILFYMPTFRKTPFGEENGVSNLFGFENFDVFSFDTFLFEHNLHLILKLHPLEEGLVARDIIEKKLRNITLITEKQLKKEDMEFYETLNAADLLITDYSSVYFDYLLLDRPLIFVPVDLEEYIETRGLLLEPYDAWTPGPKCLDQAHLEREIVRNLTHPEAYTQERKALSRIVHRYRDGNASDRVWRLIDQLMRDNKGKKV
ncbi:MAG: CDP-glycerol glycerophosphotransferase family protein [Halanaerobiales bacterium]